MLTILILTRLVLCLVFLIAGIAKLFDLAGSKKAMSDFGVPGPLAALSGILLPLCELTLAAAFIPVITAWFASVGALALLLIFIAGMSINLALGRKPDCHCFGQLHNTPIGTSTLIRNTILAALACIVVTTGRDNPGPSFIALLGSLTAGQVIGLSFGIGTAVVLSVQGWFLLHLSRQNGRLLLRLDTLEARLGSAGLAPASVLPQGVPIGTDAPPFQLPDLEGKTVSLDNLRANNPVLLIFSDPNCRPCNALMPDIALWQRQHQDKMTIALISRGRLKDNQSRQVKYGLSRILLQKDYEVSEAYQARGTPGAVIVSKDGKIGSYAASGVEAIRGLVAQFLAAGGQVFPTHSPGNGNRALAAPAFNEMRPALKTGDPAPTVQLSDLAGTLIDLADFLGQQILVLFWNPACGYCQRMLPALRTWEEHPSEGAPRILLVSRGAVEANRAMNLKSVIVLDPLSEVTQAFGSGSTPSAILIDVEGRIASELVVGATAIFKVIGIQQPSESSSPAMIYSRNMIGQN